MFSLNRIATYGIATLLPVAANSFRNGSVRGARYFRVGCHPGAVRSAII